MPYPAAQSVIYIGDLVIDRDRKIAVSNGATVHLEGKEYWLLEYLSQHLGEPASAQRLTERCYGGIDTPERGIMEVVATKLQRKIGYAGGRTTIVLIPGKGYLLHTRD